MKLVICFSYFILPELNSLFAIFVNYSIRFVHHCKALSSPICKYLLTYLTVII